MDVTNSAVIVTGAGSGMGAATARHLASLGAKVACLDISQQACQQVANEIQGLAIECDVADEAQVAQAIAAAQDLHGVTRIVVNCAGIAPAARLVSKQGPHELTLFKQVLSVNLIGTFNLMRLLAAEMTRSEAVNPDQERGVIINTASVAAFEGQIGQAAYSASKGGVVAMTMPAAREFAQFGIRVNAIAPGLIATPMLLRMPQEVQTSLGASVPFPKRLGKPEEYAGLVQHIIENPMINGEVIRLDGALRMQAK